MIKAAKFWFMTAICMFAFAIPAMAQETQINTGDTAWILISAALVLFMTLGLAFFYGGLVRR